MYSCVLHLPNLCGTAIYAYFMGTRMLLFYVTIPLKPLPSLIHFGHAHCLRQCIHPPPCVPFSSRLHYTLLCRLCTCSLKPTYATTAASLHSTISSLPSTYPCLHLQVSVEWPGGDQLLSPNSHKGVPVWTPATSQIPLSEEAATLRSRVHTLTCDSKVSMLLLFCLSLRTFLLPNLWHPQKVCHLISKPFHLPQQQKKTAKCGPASKQQLQLLVTYTKK